MLSIGSDAVWAMASQVGAVVSISSSGMRVEEPAGLDTNLGFCRGVVKVHRVTFQERLAPAVAKCRLGLRPEVARRTP